jgi:radical SAM superfamily enzyme YgiQ (UPF0313 family)
LKDIVLTTINAKWIHPSLALRLLKANLGSLETQCEIIEFNLRQPLCEKTESLLAASPRILGISVSIWNHLATIELLEELEKKWEACDVQRPIVVLGGPEVSHLPDDAKIFEYTDYIIRGEGETAFCVLCESILQKENETICAGTQSPAGSGWLAGIDARFGVAALAIQPYVASEALRTRTKNLNFNLHNNLSEIKTTYHLYTDEDISKKLIYVESTRGCPFECDFCLSAVKSNEQSDNKQSGKVREFPLESFLADMDLLVKRGAKTFKFLDRTFNTNINRAIKICDFFLQKMEERKKMGHSPFVVHFEMVPLLFPQELCETLAKFPPDSLRLEIGIQTLNPEVSAQIHRPGWRNNSINPEKELETLRFLREKTNAIIHADLIAGLPGEDLESFGRGFDRLWQAVSEEGSAAQKQEMKHPRVEIQLGILKQLPGTPISHHNETFGMRYNCQPPYEIEETSSISTADLQRLKNFARFWEQIVNRGLLYLGKGSVFEKYMALSDALLAHFGRNWGIDKVELAKKASDILYFAEP